jgi:uncharacterized membrane protein HdeD (DUF308 family)
MLLHPVPGSLALVYTIGIYAIIEGVLLIAFSFRLRNNPYTDI